MDLRSGQPWWLLKNGLLATYPSLDRNRTCDVAIIGGGITGALIADELCREGASVIVLDRRDIGMGSTCASTALLQYEIDVPLHRLQSKIGESHAARAYLLGVETIHQIGRLASELDDSCGFGRVPSVQVASRSGHVKGLERELRCRERIGIEVELWDSRTVKSRLGFSAPAALRSAVAGQIDPYQFTHQLLKRGCKHGLCVFDRVEAKSVARHRSGWRISTDSPHCIKAQRVIFAGGYEASQYIKRKITDLHSTYALVSEPLERRGEPWHESSLVWETAHPYLYCRTEVDGRVLVGGADVPFRNPAARDRLLQRKTVWLSKRFTKWFPRIPMQVAFAWCGTFADTKDGLPYIGETPEWPGCLFALGYGGNGITFSVIAARLITDNVLGRRNPDADIFRFDRPAK